MKGHLNMQKLFINFLILSSALWCVAQAEAAEFKCRQGRVTKSGSTHYNYREYGSEVIITRSGSTRGRATRSGSKWVVKVSGSSKARFDNYKIYRSGSSWATISEAQWRFDCPSHVAATLWVLMELGEL